MFYWGRKQRYTVSLYSINCLSLKKNSFSCLAANGEKQDKSKIKADYLVNLGLTAQSPPLSSFPSLENQIIFSIVTGKLISLISHDKSGRNYCSFFSAMITVDPCNYNDRALYLGKLVHFQLI